MTTTPEIDGAEAIGAGPCVGLFVTCLADLFRPSVATAALLLLEKSGCRVEVPAAQTCCGQPAWNSGDRENARAIGRQVIEAFEGYDYVVAPSGSCAGMIAKHFPALFASDDAWEARAMALAGRTHELVAFLVDVRGVLSLEARFEGRVAYHDGCAGLREMGVKHQPRVLLRSIDGLELRELPGAETCCGFGGMFCVKYPEISNAMVDDKSKEIEASGANTLLAGDLGCLLNIAGKLRRRGSDIAVRHVAEVLAGLADRPAIGAPADGNAAAADGNAAADGDSAALRQRGVGER